MFYVTYPVTATKSVINIKNIKSGAREMTSWLRVHVALAKDLDLVPTTQNHS